MYREITLKYLVDREKTTLRIGEDITLFREIFLVGKMSKVLAVGWDSLLILKFCYKGLGEGGNSIPGGGNKKKEGTFLVRRRIQVAYRYMILRDNPAGHCFILNDLAPRSFSNKLPLCYWKCTRQRKIIGEFV